ncbi:hypothetical protein FJZ22_02370 [Candidatus Pacearchaeota archaeon]|nr:hypothetical protein [Candidatus Pacearchaeota archaeon]
MEMYYRVPTWFFGFDIGMEILYACIAALIAYQAYKVYKISEEQTIKHLTVAFGLISLSYIIWAGVNSFIFNTVANAVEGMCIGCLRDIAQGGLYLYTGLFIAGLVSLVYATLNIKKPGVYYLLLGLALTIMTISIQKFATSRVVALFFITYILYHYVGCYKNTHNPCTKTLIIAFTLLLISSIDFLFSPRYYEAYVIGHIFELGAYATFWYALIQIKKHGKQKKN